MSFKCNFLYNQIGTEPKNKLLFKGTYYSMKVSDFRRRCSSVMLLWCSVFTQLRHLVLQWYYRHQKLAYNLKTNKTFLCDGWRQQHCYIVMSLIEILIVNGLNKSIIIMILIEIVFELLGR